MEGQRFLLWIGIAENVVVQCNTHVGPVMAPTAELFWRQISELGIRRAVGRAPNRGTGAARHSQELQTSIDGPGQHSREEHEREKESPGTAG